MIGLALGWDFLSAGASGAIFGLFGAIIFPIKQESPKKLKGMIIIGIIFLIFSGLNYNVDHISHWIGFIVGLLLGRLFTQRRMIKHEVVIEKPKFKRKIKR